MTKQEKIDFIISARDMVSSVLKQIGVSISDLVHKANMATAMMAFGITSLTSFYAISRGIKAVVDAATRIEYAKDQLIALTGSAREAGEVIAWVREQAWKTPFNFPNLIEMTTQLKSVGMDAKDWFKDVGNLALMSGRSMAEGMEMATRGIVRLKSGTIGEALQLLRHMKISQEDLRRQGAKFDAQSALAPGTTREKALDALQKAIRWKFGNVMKLMEGDAITTFSNIKDAFWDLMLSFAGMSKTGKIKPGSMFDELKRGALDILNWFSKNEGTIRSWATKAGDAVAIVIQYFKDMGPKVVGTLKTLYDSLANIWDGFTKFIAALVGVDAASANMTDSLRTLAEWVYTLSKWWSDAATMIGKGIKETIAFFKGLAYIFYMIGDALVYQINLLKSFGEAIIGIIPGLDIFGETASRVFNYILGGWGRLTFDFIKYSRLWKPAIDGVVMAVDQSLETIGFAFVELLPKMIANPMNALKILREESEKMNTHFMKEWATWEAQFESIVQQINGGPDWRKWTPPKRKPLKDEVEGLPHPNWDPLPKDQKEAWTEFREVVGAVIKPIQDYHKALEDLHQSRSAGASDMIGVYSKWIQQEEHLLRRLPQLAKEVELDPNDVRYKEVFMQHQAGIEKLKTSIREVLPMYATSIASVKDAWSKMQDQYGSDTKQIQSINNSTNAWKGVEEEYRKIINTVKEGSPKWQSYMQAIVDAQTKIMENNVKIQITLPRMLSDESVNLAKAHMDYVAQTLGYSTQLQKSSDELMKSYRERLTSLDRELQYYLSMGRAVDVNKIQQEILATKTEMFNLQKSMQFEQPTALADSAIDATKSYMEYMKQVSEFAGGINSAVVNVISAEREKLGILQQQLAFYERMNDAVNANRTRQQIYDIKGEIISLQKSLRQNLEDEFDKMAQKIINAPQNLQQILARSGVTLWRKQMEFLQKQISYPMPNPEMLGNGLGVLKDMTRGAINVIDAKRGPALAQTPNPNVYVYVTLDGERLEQKVETYVDTRLRQYGVK